MDAPQPEIQRGERLRASSAGDDNGAADGDGFHSAAHYEVRHSVGGGHAHQPAPMPSSTPVFLGHAVGEIGLSAMTVANPITIVFMAIAMLIGNGGNALAALRLGEGKRDDAERAWAMWCP